MSLSYALDSDEDILYEEDVLRMRNEVKPWLRYLVHKTDAPQKTRNMLYERALSNIPGSYKLWFAYLQERVKATRGLRPDHPGVVAVNNVFERALVFMHKMPRIWQDYLRYLSAQPPITSTRRAFDRALQSLPVTQHDRVWPLYLKWVRRVNVDELTVRVFRRFLKFDPAKVEEYVDILVRMEKFDEAATRLAQALNDEGFTSCKGKSRHDLWMDLCSIISKHPEAVTSLNVEAVMRQGLKRYTAEVGRLWVAMADYYIRSGLFEKARDVFHEAITTVLTVRDFSLVFDAYTQFEESLITAKMEQMDSDDEDEGMEDEGKGEGGDGDGDYARDLKLFEEEADDVDIRLERLDQLMHRRPELLNSVLLRQNPHNVHEWHKRIKLFDNDPRRKVLTFGEAVQTVNPKKAKGKPHTLWTAFARFYEEHANLDNARKTFEKAVRYPFRHIDDLASVWCEYAEMELRHKEFGNALQLMKRATAGWRRYANKNQYDENVPVQQRVHRSLRLWSFYVDLQESLGSVMETKEVYDQMIQIKAVTPQHIMNLATLLEESKYFEESFRAFEKGVALFSYPHVRDLWVAYLTKFVARYGAKKLERARDLFEQAVDKVPADQAKELYLMYARLEEEFGLARRAMAVYERATEAVDDASRFEMFEIYLARASDFYGVTRTREIYERAIEAVPDHQVKDMCIRFAALERKLGEIDRARAIYIHMSQYCDPRSCDKHWKVWEEFEVAHGNTETFKDMLRIKRNVQAQYAQANFMTKGMVSQANTRVMSDKEYAAQKKGSLVDEMQALEQLAAPMARKGAIANEPGEPGEPASSNGNKGVQFAAGGVAGGSQQDMQNPEEIELGDGDDDDGDDQPAEAAGPSKGGDIQQIAVPATVFGSALKGAQPSQQDAQPAGEQGADDDGEPKGALSRFKRV